MSAIHSFSVKTVQGQEKNLREFEGKAMLIVNVASKCGFTPQYEGLEKLYQDFKDKGLVVLGFPCNQFLQQEPGSDAEIQQFCGLTYNVSFPIFSKINVNGPETHPLYAYLKKQKRGFLGTQAIKWNFTKFLVDPQGHVVARFGSRTEPAEIRPQIEKLLK